VNGMQQKYLYRLIMAFCILPSGVFAGQYNFSLEGLALQPSQQTSSTWATIITSGTVTGVRTIDISATNIKFNYAPGVRAGLEYIFNDNWSSNFSYSYLNTATSQDVRMSSQVIVPEFFSGFLSGNFFFGADINWRILFNTIDLDVGKTISVEDIVQIRPAIGIKAANIHQKITSTWDTGVYIANEHVKNNFYGLGPSIDLDIDWQLYANKHNSFLLLGDFTTALLWGTWRVNDTYSRPNAPSVLVTATEITTNFNNMQLGVPMFGFIFGLQWNYERGYRINFKIGYEMQWWINQLRIPTFQQLPTRGDLTLQGAICGISLQL